MESDNSIGVRGGQGRNPEVALSEPHIEEETTRAMSEDDVFGVLCNRRRRQVIEYLRGNEGTATVGELAEDIAATEEETTVRQLSSDERKRVYVSLYQNHLPMMDDAAVVDYDADRKTVCLRDSLTELEPYLPGGVERPDRRVRIAAALVGALLVLVGGLQVGAFALTSPAVWSLLGVIGLLAVVALDRYRS